MQSAVFKQEMAREVKINLTHVVNRRHLQAPVCSHFCGEGVRKRARDLLLLWQRVFQQAKVAAACREEKLSRVTQNHLPLQPLWQNIH